MHYALVIISVMSFALVGCGGSGSSPPPQSWDDMVQRVAAVAEQTNFLAAEIADDGRCVPIAGTNRDVALGLASTHKLYVLATLADAIEEGRMAWDDVLVIRDAWKSVGSGRLHREAAGTPMTLEEYATLMISISDNTATDHLLFHLGRLSVEEFQTVAGHAAPALNIPFLATRELHLLKGVLTQDEVEAYLALDAPARRVFLETELAARDLSAFEGWDQPRYIFEIQWFATPNDLCAVMSVLRTQMMTRSGEPVDRILSQNPGLSFGAVNWPFIGFKGGGGPGVSNSTWLLRRFDDRWFFLTFGYNDTRHTIEADEPIILARAAANLLLTE